jgi:hypothetical protein
MLSIAAPGLVCWLLIIAVVVHGTPSFHYKVVKCCEGGTGENNGKMWLLFKNTYREIPDKETVASLGFDPENIPTIQASELTTKQLRTPPVALIKNDKSNPDAVMALEMAKIRAIVPKDLVYDFTVVCDGCKNPAVLKWNHQLIAVSEYVRIRGDVLHFFWVNSSSAPIRDPNLYGITMQPNDAVAGITIPGTDARILVDHKTNNLIVAYYPRFRQPLRVGYAELSIVNNKATWTNMYDAIIPHEQDFPKEKNWAPFFYNDSLLFVQTMNPFHVNSVAETDVDGKKYLQATTISKEPADIQWAYGQLRGGTNPIKLHDRYIAFFHSIGDLGSSYKTYFFGAYSFSLHPPFKLLSYSPVPIIHDIMYTGPWYNYRGIRYDYAAYPMALFLEKKGVLHLSYGHNDIRGYVCRINVDELLESMVPVGSL